MTQEINALFFDAIKKPAYANKRMSLEHFSVDGTLLEARASMKSLRTKDGSEDDEEASDFHGKTRNNETHESQIDSDANLFRRPAGKAVPHGAYRDRESKCADRQLLDQCGHLTGVGGWFEHSDATILKNTGTYPQAVWRSAMLVDTRWHKLCIIQIEAE